MNKPLVSFYANRWKRAFKLLVIQVDVVVFVGCFFVADFLMKLSLKIETHKFFDIAILLLNEHTFTGYTFILSLESSVARFPSKLPLCLKQICTYQAIILLTFALI